MTDHRDPSHDDSIERRLRELPDVEADPRFAEKLKAAFVAGNFQAERRLAPRPRSIIMWRWVGVAVAAGLVLFTAALVNRGPAWQVADVAGTAPFRIDGVPFEAFQTGEMEHAFLQPAGLEVPDDGRLDLVLPELAMFEVTGGTHMTLPDRPGRWIGRAVSCSLFVGEVRLKTGPRYAGTTLNLYTPDGMVVVTGTLLSVQCDDGGTCVCVLEGTAHVGLDAHRLEPVTPGYRKIMLKDGTVEIIKVKPMHEQGVLDFDRRMGDWFDSGDR